MIDYYSILRSTVFTIPSLKNTLQAASSMKWKEWFHRRFTIIGIPPFTYHIIIIEQEHFRYFCQLNIPIYRTFSHNAFNTKSIHSTPYHFYDKSVLSVLSSENFGIWNPSQDKSWDSLRCLYFLESTLGLLTSTLLFPHAYQIRTYPHKITEI